MEKLAMSPAAAQMSSRKLSRRQPRWGVSQNYADPVQNGATYQAAYSEGRDAGSLTIKSSAVALDGTVYGGASAVAGAIECNDIPRTGNRAANEIVQAAGATDRYSAATIR